jgi:hypothetical protein
VDLASTTHTNWEEEVVATTVDLAARGEEVVAAAVDL